VIVAGIVAIVGSLIVLVGTSFVLVTLLFLSLPETLPEQPPFARIAGTATLIVAMACSIFGIATGIGLLRLRNWARISALVWAGISFFFGLIGIPIALFMSLPPTVNSPGVPGNFPVLFRLILLGIYGAPLAVGIWWLILFTRKPVKEQFLRTATPVDLSLPQKPRCPVPIAVLAWFFITSAANVIIIPLLPFRMPALLFGHLFVGAVGILIYLMMCLLLVLAGVGLLKLKLWSYPIAIGLHLFWLTSGIISVLSPNFDAMMTSMVTEMNSAMHLPPDVIVPINFVQNMRWFMYLSFLIPIAIVVMLFYYRERFLEAVSAART
jgi:hypothetical protein